VSDTDDYGQLLAEVGDSLRIVRERDGWSVSEMAVTAGLEESEVRAIEAGEGGLDNTETLGQLLSAIGFMRDLSGEIAGSVEETGAEESYRVAPRLMRRLGMPFSTEAGGEA
jgi:transcriptional regulator with XRE-family HTH domain